MKKYIVYGSSILFGRGLEYFILFLAPLILSKEDYGKLEFYKKIIELGTVFLSLGLPTLILTYPRSSNSKKYFTFLSFILISVLALLLAPVAYFSNFLLLLTPIYFHAIFFNNGIVPPYILTEKGSNYASIYKSLISFIFYIGVLFFLLYSPKPYLSFVHINYVVLPVFLIWVFLYFKSNKLNFNFLKSYWHLFKKLILSSFTIVISNIINMMFLYTDILIIKFLSNNANLEIANYSFSLNISNILVIIPLTLVQVDIEKLKKNYSYTAILNKKITRLILVLAIILPIIFFTLTHFIYKDFEGTYLLFTIILLAKIFQSSSILYGAQIIIKKEFFKNLQINASVLLLNIVLSYFFHKGFGLLGVAFASLISLCTRHILLLVLNRKFARGK